MNQIYALIGIAILLFVLVIYFAIKYIKTKKVLIQKQEELLKPYKDKIRDLEAEIKRLEFIIEQTKEAQKKESEKIYTQEGQNISIQTLIAEKNKLEKEKEGLKEKTKKLWEQSLAIHKEKERIDKLRKDIERRHREITDSITYASRIQSALLPKEQDISEYFDDYFILWHPRDIVSGDFYWFNKFGNRIFAVAADCTGHGVPGAFMSLLGISFLNEIINANPTLEANEILERMRELVTKALNQKDMASDTKDGMDMALLIFDTDKNTVQYSGANNPMYLVRDGELTEYKAVRNPIGVYIKKRNFEKHEIQLKSKDRIYIFSDGYPDQFGGKDNRKFTYRRFKNLLIDMNKNNLTMKEQKEKLWDNFIEWKGKNSQIDDILVIGIQW